MHTQLTQKQRCQIQALKTTGLTENQVAKTLKVSKSTINLSAKPVFAKLTKEE